MKSIHLENNKPSISAGSVAMKECVFCHIQNDKLNLLCQNCGKPVLLYPKQLESWVGDNGRVQGAYSSYVTKPESLKSTPSNSSNVKGISENINNFDVLLLPHKFDIARKTLDANYFSRLSQVHPDKFARASKEELEIASTNAALITNAYETLKSRFTRAQELLKIAGIDPALENVDHDFLVQAMLWQEELEDADEESRTKLESQFNTTLDQYWAEIEKCFINGDNVRVKTLLAKIKLIERLADETK